MLADDRKVIFSFQPSLLRIAHTIDQEAGFVILFEANMQLLVRTRPPLKPFRLEVQPWDTIEAVKGRIRDEKGIMPEEQMLYLSYSQLEDSRTLVSYGLQRGSSVRLCLREEDVVIHFSKCDEDWEEILIGKPSDTIQIVKAKSRFLEPIWISPSHVWWVMENNHGTVNYKCIIGSLLDEDDELWLVLRPSVPGGGIEFDFNSLNTPICQPFAKSAPNYRTVGQGLSFGSKCIHQGCVAYNEVIYVTKGLGTFDIGRESMLLKCPECNNLAAVSTNCGFYLAKWKFSGVIKSTRELIEKEGKTKSQDYYTWQNGEDTTWACLEVQVEAYQP